MIKESVDDPPQITIAMPVYNGAKTLERAVNSILNQTYQHWQLLILDDGSTDTSIEIAKKFNDNRIVVLTDGQRKGITPRLNQAIELAKGHYFARMDADDFSYPERFSKQVAFLEAHPYIDLVGTHIRLVDKAGNCIGVRTFPTHHTEITAKPWLKSISVAHPTWCGKTAWFQQWKYRTMLKNEDQDLLLRAHESSRYANLPEILLDYTFVHTFQKSLLSRVGSAKVIHHYFVYKRQPFRYIISLFLVFIKLILDFFSKK
ncbi:glycosyltransferase family 2 protein [Runella slithyformis]|uniref:Glycosyl transferase family 2 n=1 Tax=Runella slithyformis (strain ATCC 29530 / DSM 19594 / LMG 11500 / NCIMB 11436 / LSU 4) TaxID=761193 RepID=A0A7U3ZJ64_RUNSL|nr:glycosyltransferase [Runella slithyformis]AEI48142.1 glycosyl transferase family 2 [Runella slithyformis DSM 19594]